MIREYMCGRVYVGLGGVRVGNGGGHVRKVMWDARRM